MADAFNATVAVAERFITSTDGTSIFAQAVGDSRLPTLVFVHGLAMSALVWAKILQDANLLKFFHLVAYDLRGHGRSGKPDAVEGYSSELYAQDFNAVVKAFNVKSPILVGWSLGATIAADVTAHYGPDALAGIVYTAALPWLSVQPIVASQYVQSLVPGLTTTTDPDLSIATRIEFVTQVFNRPEKVPTETFWSWIAGSMLQPPSKFPFLMARTQNTTNLFKAGAKGVPLLIVNGEADKFIVNEKLLEVVDGHFKDVTVHTIANGSHAFFYENQKDTTATGAKCRRRGFTQVSNVSHKGDYIRDGWLNGSFSDESLSRFNKADARFKFEYHNAYRRCDPTARCDCKRARDFQTTDAQDQLRVGTGEALCLHRSDWPGEDAEGIVTALNVLGEQNSFRLYLGSLSSQQKIVRTAGAGLLLGFPPHHQGELLDLGVEANLANDAYPNFTNAQHKIPLRSPRDSHATLWRRGLKACQRAKAVFSLTLSIGNMVNAFNATAAVAERFITSTDGTSIFAQAVGDSRLPTLVFIHGLAMSALVWAKILQDANLLRLFHLIAYDLRGHGRSGKPDTVEGYSSELYAQDFNTVVQAFNVSSPILVGWSLGATIATDVTTYFGPDALAGIVFTAALPWLSVQPIVSTPYVGTLVPGLATTTDSDLSLASRIEFVTQLFNRPEKLPTEVFWSWIGGSVLQPPSKFNFLLARSQNTTNLFEAGANGVPLLIVNGEADRFINNEKVVEVVDGHFTDVTVHTIANGSHALFYEDQNEYVRELAKFARRVFANRSK
ncbi:hypothetical protein NMY22_g13054 [Coprinellus aureogranulatus]|nr:hypothetical protein NMY22_g13054 [Coprinellus aureogranulatus]